MSFCNRCNYNPCRCNNSWNSSSNGCDKQVNSNCIFYSGITTSCTPIIYGQTLTTILQNLDTKICSISNPSGNIYVVQGVTNQTTVSTSTVGNTTTYTVGLSSTITDELNTINSEISTLTACCASSVKSISTDDPSTLDISDDSSGNYTINTITPSGTVIYDGIVSNNVGVNATNGLGGIQTLKSYNRNYVTLSTFSPDDEIRFIINGTTLAVAGITDEVIVDFLDVNTATVVGTTTFTGFNTVNTTNYQINGKIFNEGGDIDSASYDIKLEMGSGNIGSLGTVGTIFQKLSAPISGIANMFTNFTIRVRYNNLSTSNSGDNSVYRLAVEVRKKI